MYIRVVIFLAFRHRCGDGVWDWHVVSSKNANTVKTEKYRYSSVCAREKFRLHLMQSVHHGDEIVTAPLLLFFSLSSKSSPNV